MDRSTLALRRCQGVPACHTIQEAMFSPRYTRRTSAVRDAMPCNQAHNPAPMLGVLSLSSVRVHARASVIRRCPKNQPTQGSHSSIQNSAMRSAAVSGTNLAQNLRQRSRPSGCHGGLPTSSKRSRHGPHRGCAIQSTTYMFHFHFQHQKHWAQPKEPMETNPRETMQ